MSLCRLERHHQVKGAQGHKGLQVISRNSQQHGLLPARLKTQRKSIKYLLIVFLVSDSLDVYACIELCIELFSEKISSSICNKAVFIDALSA